jgi:hypothetical protein
MRIVPQLQAYATLIKIDFMMRSKSLESIFHLIRSRVPARTSPGSVVSIAELCHMIDLACVFYAKPVLCLQRSAATVLMLRRYGWHAEMVIGVQVVPFKSHAWAEVDQKVVNDKPYMHEIYGELHRC